MMASLRRNLLSSIYRFINSAAAPPLLHSVAPSNEIVRYQSLYRVLLQHSKSARPPYSSFFFNNSRSGVYSRDFCSPTSNLDELNSSQGPAAVDYSALLQEDEFHKLADSTIHDLLEKIEEYGDSVDIDGFDIDYGNQVLTVKFGSLGTYVLNKQTPNRQIWMSSPVSGPSRFDWDQTAEAWIYRRTKARLVETLETEIQQLCGDPIKLS